MPSGIAAVFQQYWKALSGRKLQIIFVALVMGVASAPSAAADYLSELEAEAESSASVLDEDVADPVPARGGAIGNPRPVASGRKGFERALKAERPNVYTFYDRLQKSDKAQVVEYHTTSSGKMSKTVNLILDLYFQKK